MFVKQNDFAFGTAPWTITKILASPDNTIPKAKEFFAHEKSAREQIFNLWWQNQGHRSDTSGKSELDNEVIEAWDAIEEYPEIRVKWKNLQFLAEFFKSEISALQAQPVAVVVSKPFLSQVATYFNLKLACVIIPFAIFAIFRTVSQALLQQKHLTAFCHSANLPHHWILLTQMKGRIY